MSNFPQKWYVSEGDLLDVVRVQVIGKDTTATNAFTVLMPGHGTFTAWSLDIYDSEIDAINQLRKNIEVRIKYTIEHLERLRNTLENKLPKRMALARINAAIDPDDDDDEESTPLETGEPVGEVTK